MKGATSECKGMATLVAVFGVSWTALCAEVVPFRESFLKDMSLPEEGGLIPYIAAISQAVAKQHVGSSLEVSIDVSLPVIINRALHVDPALFEQMTKEVVDWYIDGLKGGNPSIGLGIKGTPYSVGLWSGRLQDLLDTASLTSNVRLFGRMAGL